MLVKEVMKTNLVVIPQTMSCREAAEILLENKISGAPVVDENGKLVGVISEKDLFKAVYPSYHEFYLSPENFADFEKMEKESPGGEKKVAELMSSRLITATPQTPILKIGAIMVATGIHRVPVVEDGRLIGIVSRRDIYRVVLKECFKL